MPYIDAERRKTLESKTCETYKLNPGEINYFITMLLDGWLESNGVNYTNINTLIGVLECAKLELYRRVAAPYEDVKRIENGEVYTVCE